MWLDKNTDLEACVNVSTYIYIPINLGGFLGEELMVFILS